MNIRSIALLCLLPLLAWANLARAAESYDNCNNVITSIPTVISTQGTWCLKADLTTAISAGDAITINTNNVTIDCNNFKLGGLAAGPSTQTLGIHAIDHLNSTIRNCNIRGFYYGVLLEGASGGGHAVLDNRFDGNTHVGVQVEGDGSVILRNRVFDTGGSPINTLAFGIYGHYAVDVLDNTVSGVAATGGSNNYVYGIFTFENPSGRVIGNGVSGLVPDGTGIANGIYNENSGHMTLRNNDVVGDGSVGSWGIRCLNSQGVAKDNVISAFATAITLCSDAGGNFINP